MNDRRYNAFLPEAPEGFAQAILESRALIRRYEKRRRRLRKCVLFAAGGLAVCLAVGLGVLRHPAKDDVIAEGPVTPEIEVRTVEPTEAPGVVLSHPEGDYYHKVNGGVCVQSRGDEVEIPLETAENFGKLPCPDCFTSEE